MTWQHKFFLSVFYSSQRPSQIGLTADFDGAAITPPIFYMVRPARLQFCLDFVE